MQETPKKLKNVVKWEVIYSDYSLYMFKLGACICLRLDTEQ